ncbi:MAG: hypothetical protein F6K04_05030 [Leptolyngbya sp. SIO4C5]|nr:hypothetical protein [Leptolyngbya sp. SIO4C5]
MAAALKRDIEKTAGRRRSRSVVPMLAAAKRAHSVPVSVEPGPAFAAPQRPLWLQLLLGLYQGTTVLSGGLLIAVLALYGSTVYVDKSLQAGAQRLEALRRSQHQLTTANEVLKQHLAEQAEAPGAALELPQPNSLIFLSPAATEATESAAVETEVPPHPALAHPLGY